MSSRAERIQGLLRSLVTNTPDVEGSAVVSTDGLVMASQLAAGTDEEKVAGMAAAVLALGERTARELARGELEQVYVKGDGGHVVLMDAGADSMLTTITGEDAKLGLVLLEMKRAAGELRRIL